MRIISLLLLFLLTVVLFIPACKPSHVEQSAKDTLRDINSEDWKVREKSLVLLGEIGDEDYKPSPELQKELVSLLSDETVAFKTLESTLAKEGKKTNEIIKKRSELFPAGEYDDYIRMLSHYSAINKIDGGLKAIFRLLVETNYKVSPAILTTFGKENIGFFIDKVNSGTQKEREIALCVLSIWSDEHVESEDFDTSIIPQLDTSEKDILKPIFLKQSNDPNYNIRDLVLSGLGNFIQDPAVKKQIEQMASSDNEKFIRNKARRILDKQK